MFDAYREQFLEIRSAHAMVAASLRALEETDLTDAGSIARWLQELDRAAAAGDLVTHRASELRTAIAAAWPRSAAAPGHPGRRQVSVPAG
jgi:hypothetical protein